MSQHDDLTDTLTRELEEQAHAMDGSLLHLSDVRGRARSIRRRRQATAVAGVAAAIAVIVPLASFAGHTGGSPEPAPATQTPTVTRTATPADKNAALDISGLPVGKAPAPGYLAGGKIHTSDGGTGSITSVSAPIDRFALLGDGTAVFHTRDDQGHLTVQVRDAGGTAHGPYAADDGLVEDSTRTSAAWVSPDGQVHAWVATETSPRTIGTPVPGAGPQVTGVTGDCSAACRVLVRTSDPGTGDVTDWLVASDGPALKVAPKNGFVTANDVSGNGDQLGYTHIGDGTSCSAVSDPSGTTAWRTCEHTLLAFSPDATSVSADVAYHSGDGSSVIAAYAAADGTLLFEHQSTLKTQAVVQGTVWEDDTHLLAVVRQGLEWSVVRFGVDGSMELAVPPVEGKDDLRSPIVLGGARG